MTYRTRSQPSDSVSWPPPSPPKGTRPRRPKNSTTNDTPRPQSGPCLVANDQETEGCVDGVNASTSEMAVDQNGSFEYNNVPLTAEENDEQTFAQLEDQFMNYDSPLSSPPSTPGLTVRAVERAEQECVEITIQQQRDIVIEEEGQAGAQGDDIDVAQEDLVDESSVQRDCDNDLRDHEERDDLEVPGLQQDSMLGGEPEHANNNMREIVEMDDSVVDPGMEPIMVTDGVGQGATIDSDGYVILPEWIQSLIRNKQVRESALRRVIDPNSSITSPNLFTAPSPPNAISISMIPPQSTPLPTIPSPTIPPPTIPPPTIYPPTPVVTVASVLDQLFPEQASEVNALAHARSIMPMSRLAAYRWFRYYHILYTVSHACQVSLTNRANTSAHEIAPGMSMTIADIFRWVGVVPGTFSNWKLRLQHTFDLVTSLQKKVMEEPVDDLLKQKYRDQWRPYLISYDQWARCPEQQYPLSLRWSIENMTAAASETASLM
ncbi:hypothetical protein V5O48_014268 [Marasmius crinis-equi]|uniref:Uncharacterized protein n=1 Tax=Marasmius crinis-equi TaxID=585013 RepID=A0ABR3EXS0_9AGAR